MKVSNRIILLQKSPFSGAMLVFRGVPKIAKPFPVILSKIGTSRIVVFLKSPGIYVVLCGLGLLLFFSGFI